MATQVLRCCDRWDLRWFTGYALGIECRSHASIAVTGIAAQMLRFRERVRIWEQWDYETGGQVGGFREHIIIEHHISYVATVAFSRKFQTTSGNICRTLLQAR
jgi:hypothetical protein